MEAPRQRPCSRGRTRGRACRDRQAPPRRRGGERVRRDPPPHPAVMAARPCCSTTSATLAERESATVTRAVREQAWCALQRSPSSLTDSDHAQRHGRRRGRRGRRGHGARHRRVVAAADGTAPGSRRRSTAYCVGQLSSIAAQSVAVGVRPARRGVAGVADAVAVRVAPAPGSPRSGSCRSVGDAVAVAVGQPRSGAGSGHVVHGVAHAVVVDVAGAQAVAGPRRRGLALVAERPQRVQAAAGDRDVHRVHGGRQTVGSQRRPRCQP